MAAWTFMLATSILRLLAMTAVATTLAVQVLVAAPKECIGTGS